MPSPVTRGWCVCCVLLLVGAGSTFASDIEDLVSAEHRFAAAAATDGIRDAFLGVLAADGILFRPLPVNGREWFEAQPPPPGVLAWKPVQADVSSAGDLGYTTGPWRYDLEGREPPFGHYVSIWRRAKDDTWQLVLDLGVSHDEPEASAWEPAFGKGESGEAAKGLSPDRLAALERELAEVDREFSKAAVVDGPAEAYARAGAEEIRLYRDGRFPVVGHAAVQKALEGAPASRQAEPIATLVATSGDLGYSYGTSRDTGEDEGDRFSYMRIWKQGNDDEWRIVLDILTLVP